MNLYVIGAVTGIPNDNRPEFERVRKELESAGHRVMIPHDFVACDCTWEQAMRYSIHHLTTQSYPDLEPTYNVAMLDGWENSKGAVIEHDLAEALGIPCKPWEEWL